MKQYRGKFSMNSARIIIFVIYFGQIVDTNLDGQLGCYESKNLNVTTSTIFEYNNGQVCKGYCFKEMKTNYAATQVKKCSCISVVNGIKVEEEECQMLCPGKRDAYCGGMLKMTVYDASRTTTTIPTSTTTTTKSTTTFSTTDEITSIVSSTSNSTSLNQSLVDGTTNETQNSSTTKQKPGEHISDDGILPVHYIIIIAATFMINVLVFILVILLRRMRLRRKRRKKSKASENSPNALHGSYVELNENAIVASGQNDVETEYDTTATSRPKPNAICVEGDYSRLGTKKLPHADPTYSHVGNCHQGACTFSSIDNAYGRLGVSGVSSDDQTYSHVGNCHQGACAFSSIDNEYGRLGVSGVPSEDQTYSHVRNNQQGPCALSEADYSYLGRNEMSTKWTNNGQSNLSTSDYDNVHFNQSCNVRSVKTGLKFGTYNDDVYDQLQNK